MQKESSSCSTSVGLYCCLGVKIDLNLNQVHYSCVWFFFSLNRTFELKTNRAFSLNFTFKIFELLSNGKIFFCRMIFYNLSKYTADFTAWNEKYVSWIWILQMVRRIKKRGLDKCHFGRHFFPIKANWAPFLLVFSGSLWRFSEILSGFYRIFPGF